MSRGKLVPFKNFMEEQSPSTNSKPPVEITKELLENWERFYPDWYQQTIELDGTYKYYMRDGTEHHFKIVASVDLPF